jgi:hypothetical protein
MWVEAIAAIGEAGAAVGGAAEAGIGSAAGSAITPAFESVAAPALPSMGAAEASAGAGSLGAASDFAGMGAIQPNWIQQGMDLYGKAKDMSNNHPNSGTDSQPSQQQQNQNPLFQQMLSQETQQPQRKIQDVSDMPWTSLVANKVDRREPDTQQMQLNSLMSMLGQSQLPMPGLTDTGGSGAGGSSGGFMKGIMSMIGGK